jgi:hypothetical protein
MATQPSLTSDDMVVAEIINELESSDNNRIQQMQQQMQPPQMQHPQMQQMTRSTPITRQPQQQMQQQPSPQQMQMLQQQQSQRQMHSTPVVRQQPPPQQRSQSLQQQQQPSQQRLHRSGNKNGFIEMQKRRLEEKRNNKRVRFKNKVDVLGEESDESDNDSNDSNESEEEVKVPPKNKLVMKRPPKGLLSSDDVKKGDLKETKGVYQRVMGFFTNDTKEPLLVLTLVFAMSLPIVNEMMTKYLPFLVKDGNLGILAIVAKAFVAGLIFFVIKKLLL